MARERKAIFKWVQVYYDRDWDEWQVEPRFGSVLEKERARYHASDRADAMDTAKAMDRSYEPA